MKNKIIIISFSLLMLCALGFVIGYSLKSISLKSNAANDEISYERIASQDEVAEFEDVFATSDYNVSYNENTSVYHFVYSGSKKSDSNQNLYTKKDAENIVEKLIKSEYELVIENESDYDIMYQEYQNGYPTGAYASFVFSDEGYLVEAYCRKGVIYDFDDSKMISVNKAYEIAKDAIIEKYGEEVKIKETTKLDYETTYNVKAKQLCYSIEGIEAELDGEIRYFFVQVLVDGTDVSVAISL